MIAINLLSLPVSIVTLSSIWLVCLFEKVCVQTLCLLSLLHYYNSKLCRTLFLVLLPDFHLFKILCIAHP